VSKGEALLAAWLLLALIIIALVAAMTRRSR
jgi:hypothetical protein